MKGITARVDMHATKLLERSMKAALKNGRYLTKEQKLKIQGNKKNAEERRRNTRTGINKRIAITRQAETQRKLDLPEPKGKPYTYQPGSGGLTQEQKQIARHRGVRRTFPR